MTWITDNKDSGPWPFTEQPDVWGYLNNPRWSNHPKAAADPMSASEFCEGKGIALDPEYTHKPCGHWHKRKEITTSETTPAPNLYGTGRNDYGQLGFESTTIGYTLFTQILESGCSQVYCHRYHTILVKTDGTLWVTGWNYYGQLGTGDETTVYEFTQIGSGTTWSQVSSGYGHTMAIKTDGTLWATGYNGYGQLGLGDMVDVNTFTQVGSGTDWAFVACGNFHTVAIKTDGSLYSTGANYSGQLGLGDETQRTSFAQVGSGTDWSIIDCGYDHTAAIKTDNSLWSTGYNGYGQLGLEDWSDRDEFEQIGSGTNWSDIGTGEYHTMAVKSDGTLWAVGYNDNGQLGVGSDTLYFNTIQQVGIDSDWSSADGGVFGSIGIKTDSIMESTGFNYFGQLGFGYYASKKTFQPVSDQEVEVSDDIVQGSFEWFTEHAANLAQNWNSVNQGWYHTLAIKSDGSLWACGWNYHGQLGIIPELCVDEFNLVNDYTWDFVDAWNEHTVAIKNDGILWGSGYNEYGQLGLGDFDVESSIQYNLIQLSSAIWTEVGTGTNHTATLKNDGTVWTTGRNASGQLGLGDEIDRDAFTQIAYDDWIHITAGSYVTMGIRKDTTLWSWGDNSGGNQGQLGLNDILDRDEPTQCIGTGWKQVSIGS
jgi:alpha-tubulin suppressor-like RCC1 family protein